MSFLCVHIATHAVPLLTCTKVADIAGNARSCITRIVVGSCAAKAYCGETLVAVATCRYGHRRTYGGSFCNTFKQACERTVRALGKYFRAPTDKSTGKEDNKGDKEGLCPSHWRVQSRRVGNNRYAIGPIERGWSRGRELSF